jgi:hypothetical protein
MYNTAGNPTKIVIIVLEVHNFQSYVNIWYIKLCLYAADILKRN